MRNPVWHISPSSFTDADRATDLTGTGNNGTPTNAVLSTDYGSGGNRAWTFNGSNAYLNFRAFTMPTASGTVSLWWQPNESVANPTDHPIMRFRLSSPLRLFDVYIAGGSFYAGWYNNGNDKRVIWSSGSFFTTNQWYHVVVTWVNGGATQLFVDTVYKQQSTSLNATWDTATATGRFLAFSGSTSYAANRIDEVRLYDYVISAEERLLLYQQGFGRGISTAAPGKIETKFTNGKVRGTSYDLMRRRKQLEFVSPASTAFPFQHYYQGSA